MLNTIKNEDCLQGMRSIEDKSVDMILCDLPYGVTACRWDTIIPFDKLWHEYNRIIKDNGAIVLTSIQPFTTTLISSNLKNFRYCWYWQKNQVTGFSFARYQPMRCIEDICVFYKKAPTYNPQGLVEILNPKIRQRTKMTETLRSGSLLKSYTPKYKNYPRNVLKINCQREGLHPTQKPVELFEYLIRTYTNAGDVVLDNCMGSGTTAIACLNSGRNFIGFEFDEGYYKISQERIKNFKPCY